VRATLIAPLAVPLLYCLGSLAAVFADPQRRAYEGHNLASGVGLVFAFAAPVAYAATFGLALPGLWLVRRLGRLTLVTTVAVGLVVGWGVAAVLEPHLRSDLLSVPLPPWSGALLGAAAAALWWRLARARDWTAATTRS
jgi:uncharacterized membrane protein